MTSNFPLWKPGPPTSQKITKEAITYEMAETSII